MANAPAAPAPAANAAAAAGRGPNFKPEEDKSLCTAWVTVSSDGSVGTNQDSDEFWARVKALFDNQLEVLVFDRTPGSLKSRFQTVSHDVSKFAGCYEKIKELNQSGTTEEDWKRDALELYESIPANKGRFKFLSAWFILSQEPKWGAWRDAATAKKTPRKSGSKAKRDEVEPNAVEGDLGLLIDDEEGNRLGTKKSKLEKANLALQSRQVAAAERMAKNGHDRILVAKEQMELQMFLNAPADDSDVQLFLQLKRSQALARLKASMLSKENEPHLDVSSNM